MADRHNLCVNPSLTNNATGWGGGATPTRTDVSGLGFLRTWAARYSSGTFVTSPAGAATVGQTYTVSAYVRPQTFQISGTVWIDWLGSGGSSVGSSNQAFTANAGTVTRISMTGTAPSGTVTVRLVITGEDFSVNTTDVTAVLIEQAASAGDFFDGDSPSASWDGTPGNSASTLASEVTGDVTATATAGVSAAAANTAAAAVTAAATAAMTAAAANSAAGLVAAVATTAAAATAVYATTGAAALPVVAGCTVEATTSAEEVGDVLLASGGGWYGLLDILREAADERRAERNRPPAACPNDGEPLLQGPRGQLHCPFDGWIWDGVT